MSGHTASQTAKAWRSDQTAIYSTVGGLAVCLSITTYIAKKYSATTWRTAWRSALFFGGLLHPAIPDRQTATGVAEVAE